MPQNDIPLPLAKGALRLLPPPLLARMLVILMRKMQRRNPRLFRNLSRLSQAHIHIEPTDIPHHFLLSFGGGNSTSLTLITEPPANINAHIKGTLVTLLEMLQGDVDGDTLFFNRRLSVSGDTTVIVGLRNTLDREGLDIMAEILAPLGPFAAPMGRVIHLLDGLSKHLRTSLEPVVRGSSAASSQESPLATECKNLRAEIEQLKTRLAKNEVHQKRMEQAAQ